MLTLVQGNLCNSNLFTIMTNYDENIKYKKKKLSMLTLVQGNLWGRQIFQDSSVTTY